jgi:hypothetical protein
MIKVRISAVVAIAVVLIASRASGQVVTFFTLIGASQKVCQLNGQTDWATGTPTAAQTETNFGMIAGDLGAPVDTGGPMLYLLFGDTRPADHPPGSVPEVPPDDSVGTSTLTTAPVSSTCLGLQLATTSSAPPTLARPKMTPAIDQGSFNVPSGGVYVGTSLYEFFWTNHCLKRGLPVPSPADPLLLPAATPDCAETVSSTPSPGTASLNTLGLSVLGQMGSSDVSFSQPTVSGTPATMPSGFVYVNAVDATHAPNLAPSNQQLGIFITGVPRYRASVPFLAYTTTANIADPSQWMFFNGLSGSTPNWISRAAWESRHNKAGRWVPPSSGAQIYNPSTSEQCIGEHSLSWNSPLNAWLLLYNCKGSGIEARYAPAPWGPWSDPIVLLSAGASVYCKLIMSPNGCHGLADYWPDPAKNKKGQFTEGGFYAPFVLSRFTQQVPPEGGPLTRRATIYWLVSTWNPYVVVVMQSTLQIATYYRKPGCKGTNCM